MRAAVAALISVLPEEWSQMSGIIRSTLKDVTAGQGRAKTMSLKGNMAWAGVWLWGE